MILQGGNRKKKGLGKAAVICLLLFAAIFLTSCATLTGTTDHPDSSNLSPFLVRPQNEKYLREDEWVRILALAMGYPEQRSSIWEEIPAQQKTGITQSDFMRYANFLSDCLPGTVTYFFQASEEESQTYRAQAARVDKLLDPKPAAASIWWLEAQTSDLRTLRLLLPITLDDQGIPYFSKSWISRQLALHDYVVLYMDALATGLRPALISLLGQYSGSWTPIRQEAAERRADELFRYYQSSINMSQGSYRCLSVMPGCTVVEQQHVLNESGSQRTRRVTFTETDGIYRAEEKIPQVLNKDDSLLYLDSLPLFGDTYQEAFISSETILDVLGIPLNLEIVETDEKDGKTEPDFRVTWPGLIVEASGSCDLENLTFQGTIHQISAFYSQFETGSSLKPGDTVYDLYLRYPFSQEHGYLISRSENGVTRTLAVQIESDSIVRMTLIFSS